MAPSRRGQSQQRHSPRPGSQPAPGGYLRQRLLGRGASGEVWEVLHPQSGGRFAFKEVNLQGMEAKEQELAVQEVRILRKLAHPCIV
eukprot:2313097-Amphidinium_carterae.1